MTEQNEASRKGRPTPSRREAEAARKAQMKRPLSRKEQSQRQRAARAEIRRKQQEAMNAGDGKYLPARDQGPVKRFVRDYVDSRWNVGEFLLPILVLILALSVTDQPWTPRVANSLWAATILTVAFDTWMLLRGVKRQVVERFGAEHLKGVRFYALLRSTQLRRLRLPKPQVKRGAQLR